MAHYKEIVTKAVIGKGKKTFRNNYRLLIDEPIDTVLGCWVINHNLIGANKNGNVSIKGSFDVNIWYSYDDNSKTNVVIDKVNYEENVSIKLKDDAVLSEDSEIIIRNLRNPNCVDVIVHDNTVEYEIEKELGIEIIGDTKVRIVVEDEEEEYDIIEELTPQEIDENIDREVTEEFLTDTDIEEIENIDYT